MKEIRKMAILLLVGVSGFYACEEGERFGISSGDTTPPTAPVFDSVQRLPGGGRLFYQIPPDEDVISIEASYTAANGKLIKSAASFMAPYLEVYGLPDSLEHTIQLYALDRAGNQSRSVDVTFEPLKPAYLKVAKGLTVKPAFGALLVEWENELKQDITVFVDFTFPFNGAQRSMSQVYSSRDSIEHQFIKGLNLSEQEAVSVKVTVEDLYGNRSETVDKGSLHLFTDSELDKSKFVLLNPGDTIGGVRMGYGSSFQGQIEWLIDDKIDYLTGYGKWEGVVANYACWGVYTVMIDGVNVNAQRNWNILIDLGDKYELSRIVTHQAWTNSSRANMSPTNRGFYYGEWNVAIYNMYWWDGNDAATVGEWKLIQQVKIPMPSADMGVMDIIRQAIAGDEALMYPDDPDYTPATRYFRYQCVNGFANNYNGTAEVLAELTLYGKKAP